ncbi:MAG: 50S ribosomal protein L22 [Actinobacteria bacterium]|nr:MAG: 50S ribosomal protein L22 [Actinomycetota bacterium]
MTGPKLNEANNKVGTSSGTRASVRFVRGSASKVRVVLNLIRDQNVRRADEILQFTDREAARIVRKLLASAVANAVNNDGQDADDLYVKACFADEGPTLKRFRPRAKGRAGPILKRSSHITIVLARMSDEKIAVRDIKSSARGSALSSRRARVEGSRKRTPETASAPTDTAPVESIEAAEEIITLDVTTDEMEK